MLWMALACADPDPGANLPEAGFIVGTPTAIATVSRCLLRFPESEAGAVGEAWSRAAAACADTLFVEGPGTELRCGPAPAPLLAALSGHQIRFGLPRGPAGLVSGSVDEASTTHLAASLLLPVPEEAGALSLLLPGTGGPGTSVLSNKDAFLHVRGHPEGGIDLAALVPESSQADQLFDMRSTLLSGAVLQGTWELAAYPPPPGKSMPEVVLGLGVRASTAPPAITAFAELLREKWSVRREDIAAEDWHGECLRGLNIMPEFEPCFLLRDEALAIGWNEAAVRTGTAAGSRETFETDLGIIVDTAALAASDQVLAGLFSPTFQYPPIEYPLGRIRISARSAGKYVAADLSAEGCP